MCVRSGNQQRVVNIGKSKAALPVNRQKNVNFPKNTNCQSTPFISRKGAKSQRRKPKSLLTSILYFYTLRFGDFARNKKIHLRFYNPSAQIAETVAVFG